jgi:hypothetical protein
MLPVCGVPASGGYGNTGQQNVLLLYLSRCPVRDGRSWDRIPLRARFSAPIQSSPGVHPAFYTMGTGCLFSGVKRPGHGANPLLSRIFLIHLYRSFTLLNSRCSCCVRLCNICKSTVCRQNCLTPFVTIGEILLRFAVLI